MFVSAKTNTEILPITPNPSATEVHKIFLKPGEYLEAPALGSDGILRIIRIFANSCPPITPNPSNSIPVMPTSVRP